MMLIVIHHLQLIFGIWLTQLVMITSPLKKKHDWYLGTENVQVESHHKLGFLQVCFYQRSIVSGLDTPVSIHWCYLPNLETCSIESGRKHVVLRPLYDLNMIWIYYLVSLIFRESHHIQTIFKSYSNHILVGGLEPWNFMTFPSYWGHVIPSDWIG